MINWGQLKQSEKVASKNNLSSVPKTKTMKYVKIKKNGPNEFSVWSCQGGEPKREHKCFQFCETSFHRYVDAYVLWALLWVKETIKFIDRKMAELCYLTFAFPFDNIQTRSQYLLTKSKILRQDRRQTSWGVKEICETLLPQAIFE